MRVHFTATFDELVDVHIRAARKTRNPWGEVLNGALSIAVVIWVVTYAVQENPDGRLVRCLYATLAVTVPYVVYSMWSYKSRMRAWLKGYFGADEPFDVVFELKTEGISVSQLKCTSVYEWSIVGTIEETAGDVAVQTSGSNVMMVRARAFESPEARQRFIALARQYRDAARQGS